MKKTAKRPIFSKILGIFLFKTPIKKAFLPVMRPEYHNINENGTDIIVCFNQRIIHIFSGNQTTKKYLRHFQTEILIIYSADSTPSSKVTSIVSPALRLPPIIFFATRVSILRCMNLLKGLAPKFGS